MNKTDYLSQYKNSIENNSEFWAKQAEKYLSFSTPYETVSNAKFEPPYEFSWFTGGKLNVSHHCIDRHLEQQANQTAIIWQSNDLSKTQSITYQKLYDEVNAMSALLLAQGVKAGDVVTIYMPLVPEAVYAMLACARIGAIHSVVFAGFSGEALAERLQNADSRYLITTSFTQRGNKTTDFMPILDTALKHYTKIGTLIAIDDSHKLTDTYFFAIDYQNEKQKHRDTLIAPEAFDSEHPLFILYTSGSTGKPKGLLHTSAGYLLYASMTFDNLFDYNRNDTFWCTADIGWITGHSYVVYGPLSNGATIYLYEGVPNQPSHQIWEIIQQNKITHLYTAPTLIRSLMKETPSLTDFDLSSLKLLGSVGEPINPEAWEWYAQEIGKSQLPIIDTWWQTETGGIMICPTSDRMTIQKPGLARQPFYGIEPVLLNEAKEVITETNQKGALCIKQPWPGQARTVWKDHQRFIDTYFSDFPGYYFSGDAASFDSDHEFYIAGRMDDVINVAGHRLSTAEIESALVEHETVCESAVIGKDDPIQGQSVFTFVITHHDVAKDQKLKNILINAVKNKIGSFAKPKELIFVSNLPKTRSGKIMRRVLRKIVHGETTELGDLSTLTNPEILDELIECVPREAFHK